MTMLLTITIILFGVLAYRSLPVSDLPTVDFPVITVRVSYPGATPETMASTVATPLERELMLIPGLDLITSDSSQGSTQLTLQFSLDKNVDAAAMDVQAAITQATRRLPADLPSPPTFNKVNPNDQAIMLVALTSDSLTEGQLYDFVTSEVSQRITVLDGVSEVNIYGARGAIRIKADPAKLAARNLTVDELAAAIRQGTSYQGSGQFDGRFHTFLLQPQGQVDTAEGYRRMVIGRKQGSLIYLRDVAEVIESVENERNSRAVWKTGQPPPAASIVLAIGRQAGANAVATAQSIRERLPEIEADLPSSIRLMPMYDRSVTITKSVNEVIETLLIAFALVVVVIFIFLGRATDTLIPMVALPMSILMTFIAMRWLGYSLDNLSLLALTLSIGFLVDDAIVFLENAVRRMELGETALQATFNGAKEISFTIVSMTVSLAIVFLPLVFMPGLIGRTFQTFANTIIIAIISSGIVSLTLTPLMCSRMLAKHENGRKTWLERMVQTVFSRVVDAYGATLHFFLDHKWISALVWIACMVGTVLMFQAMPKSFLPVGDSGYIRGVFLVQEGTSPERIRKFQKQVDDILQTNDAVDIGFTISGTTGRMGANQARVIAYLKPQGERPPIDKVITELSAKMNEIPGILPYLQAVPVLQISTGASSGNQGKFSYAISGTDPQQVMLASDDLMERLADYPGFLFINSDLKRNTPGLEIDILREQAAAYGVSADAILTALRNAYAQNFVYLIKKPNDQYQVVLEVEDLKRSDPSDLEKLYVRSDTGALVPVKSVTRWKKTAGPQSISHINQMTAVTLSFNLAPGVVIGEATEHVEKVAAEVLPPGVRGSFQGEAKVFQETINSLTILIVFAVFAMYVILGILYESYVHPLTVLTSLPVATIGGLATLMLFGQELSLYAFVGMFMLIGIVKKNGIMIVDFSIQRMADGLSAVEAVHEASRERFRPIMMTTFAALMGALPLALGLGADGSSRQGLGMIIVGGLVVSQLITLYLTPALFLYFEAFQVKVLDRSSFFRAPLRGFSAATAGEQIDTLTTK